MTKEQVRYLRSIEGRHVSVALRNGTRIDDCELVSGGRSRLVNLWLFANGHDVFVALGEVLDVWETHADRIQAA
jgi:hypothetical protein